MKVFCFNFRLRTIKYIFRSRTQIDFVQCITYFIPYTWKFNIPNIYKYHSKFYNRLIFFSSPNHFIYPAPGKVVNLTVEAFNSSAVNLIWYLPQQPNGKITSFKISVKHARSGVIVKDVSIRVEDILKGKLPECNVSIVEHFLILRSSMFT
jgi:hypothetical protein